MMCFGFSGCLRSGWQVKKQLRWMTGFQLLRRFLARGDPLFGTGKRRIRSDHVTRCRSSYFRRLKASFAYSAIIAGVGLSSNGAGDGPGGVLRPRRRMQRAPRSSAGCVTWLCGDGPGRAA
eukprot:756237-Hanusia_phi.AAC.5